MTTTRCLADVCQVPDALSAGLPCLSGSQAGPLRQDCGQPRGQTRCEVGDVLWRGSVSCAVQDYQHLQLFFHIGHNSAYLAGICQTLTRYLSALCAPSGPRRVSEVSERASRCLAGSFPTAGGNNYLLLPIVGKSSGRYLPDTLKIGRGPDGHQRVDIWHLPDVHQAPITIGVWQTPSRRLHRPLPDVCTTSRWHGT